MSEQGPTAQPPPLEPAAPAASNEPNAEALRRAAASARGPESVLLLADALLEAEPRPAQARAPDLHLVVFQLGAEEFALPIDRVREIVRVGTIVRVPEAPSHVRGVTSLRGRILPVVDLRVRLGLAPTEPTARSRILMAESKGRVVGLLADAVSRICRLPADRFAPPPDEVASAEGDYVVGVAPLEGEALLILLDLDRTLTSPASARPRADEPNPSSGERP